MRMTCLFVYYKPAYGKADILLILIVGVLYTCTQGNSLENRQLQADGKEDDGIMMNLP